MSEKIDEKALRTQLLSGARWSVMIRLVGQAYSWVVTLFMVRLLTPADYGLNAMLEVPIELLTLFSAMGIDSALVRFGRKDPKQIASAFGFLLLLNGLICVALFFGSASVAAYFKEPLLEDLIRVSAVVFVLSPFRTIPNALLDMSLDFKLKAQVELQATVVASMVGLGLAYQGAGVWALVSVVVVNAVLRAALLAWHRPWFVRPQLEIAQLRPLLSYGMTIIASSFILVMTGKVYSMIGGPALGAEVLGLFAVASTFSYLPISKAMPVIQQTLFPAFSKLTGEPELIRKYILNAIELCTLTIVPIGIGMASVSEDMVATFFGPQWVAVATPLAILSALTPLRVLNLIFYTPLNATGHAKVVVGMVSVSFVVFIIGIWWAIDHGLMGLVVLAVSAAAIATVITIAVARRFFNVRASDLTKVMGLPMLSCIIMAASVAALNSVTREFSPALALAAAIALGAAVYICTVMLLMRDRLRQIRRSLFS